MQHKNLKFTFSIWLMLLISIVTSFTPIMPVHAQAPQPPIAQAQILITGLELHPSPTSLVVPKNTGTIVTPLLVRPDQATGELPPLPEDTLFLAELRGPAFTTPVPLSARLNAPFLIPALPLAGLYSLENIRMVSGGQTLLQGAPDTVRIEVIDKLLATQVTSRPLTAEEIQARGIVIDQDNFQVVNFTVAFGLENKTIKVDFPMIIASHPQAGVPPAPATVLSPLQPTQPPTTAVPNLSLVYSAPNIAMTGFALEVGEDPETGVRPLVAPIPGVVIIPGNIGFLNQFFSVILKVSNVAPAYANLEVRDLQAEIVLPTGKDQTTPLSEDPLRMARLAGPGGTPQEQPKLKPVAQPGADGKLGTADDILTLGPQQNGDAEFLVEGRHEGVYTLNFKIHGTLYGLPSGPVGVSGLAVGMVEVRNPAFSLTFNHPATVSAGEEYDFLVTVTNIAETPANFATLSLLPRAISGAELLSDQVQQIETIAPGDSATVSFRLRAIKSGTVTATSIAANDTPGKFELRTAVGELGIPMSPNSLVLPPVTNALPDDLRLAGIALLNQAYAVATAPTTPKGLLPLSQAVVIERAAHLAAAGQRRQLDEPLLSVTRDLALDFLGNDYSRLAERYGPAEIAQSEAAKRDYQGFDALFRQSRRGAAFLQTLAAVWASASQNSGVLSFQDDFAKAAASRPGHISAIVSASAAPVLLTLTDPVSRQLGQSPLDNSVTQQIPYGAFFPLTNASQMALVALPQPGTYILELTGTGAGKFDLGLVVPDAASATSPLRRLTFAGVDIQAGGRARLVFTIGGANDYKLALDLEGDGVVDQEVTPAVNELVADNGPQLVSAVQIFMPGKNATKYGQIVGLLFNEEISAASSQSGQLPAAITHYQPEANAVQGVALQPGGRVVILGLRDGIGPFIPRTITVNGIADRLGNALQPDPVTAPIRPTITTEGGVISGTVRHADGTPAPFALIQLSQIELDLNDDPYPEIVSVKSADSAGRYTFDYVTRRSGAIFTFYDGNSGERGTINTQVRYQGQRLDLDLIFLGAGTLTGRVLAADGQTPLAGARIRVTNPLGEGSYGATSDANGAYLLSQIPVGAIAIQAVHQE